MLYIYICAVAQKYFTSFPQHFCHFHENKILSFIFLLQFCSWHQAQYLAWWRLLSDNY